jgi:peptidoglycan/LPS O-acetylase OafA/YrhL
MLPWHGEAAAIVLFVVGLVFVYSLDASRERVALLPGLNAGNTILPGVSTYQGPYKVMALGISGFFFALYCFGFDGLLKRAFSWRTIRYLGNMNYSYFLFHGATLKALSLLAFATVVPAGRSPLLFCLLLPLSLGATWISSTVLFAFVERPISLERLSLSAYSDTVRARLRDTVVSLRAVRSVRVGRGDGIEELLASQGTGSEGHSPLLGSTQETATQTDGHACPAPGSR